MNILRCNCFRCGMCVYHKDRKINLRTYLYRIAYHINTIILLISQNIRHPEAISTNFHSYYQNDIVSNKKPFSSYKNS